MSHEFTYWRCIPHAFSGRILRRMNCRVTCLFLRCPYCRASEFEVIYPPGNIASKICTTVNKNVCIFAIIDHKHWVKTWPRPWRNPGPAQHKIYLIFEYTRGTGFRKYKYIRMGVRKTFVNYFGSCYYFLLSVEPVWWINVGGIITLTKPDP